MTGPFCRHGTPVRAAQSALCLFLGSALIAFWALAAEAGNGTQLSGRFESVFEPSGIAVIGADVLIIEDEKDKPLHRMASITAEGRLQTKLLDCSLKLDDLESIASDGKYFFVAGSHHTKGDGTRRKKREHLSRLKVAGPSCTPSSSSPSLFKEIARVLELNSLAPNPLQVNVEALAWQHGSDRLYVALREPVAGPNAILLTLLNPSGIFARKEAPRLSDEVKLLRVGGGGLRAMGYIESLGGYLIANETVSSKGKMKSRLWYWQGSAHEPVQVKLEGLKKLKNIEGLTSYHHDKQESILVVCDDGNRKKGTGAHFALFPLADIKKAIRR